MFWLGGFWRSGEETSRPITVVTLGHDNLTETSATVSGYVNASGLANTEYFMRWGLTNPPATETTRLPVPADYDDHAYVTGLTLDPGLTYYYMMVGQPSGYGEYWGDILSFTTPSGGPSTTRLTSLGIETTQSAPGDVRLTQLGLETAQTPDGPVHVTQLGIETAQDPGSPVRVSQFGVETAAAPGHTRLTQIGLEVAQANIEPRVPIGPPEWQDFCTEPDDPIGFSSWQPAGSGTARMWFAETDLDDQDDYYGGWKEDRLLEISDVRRTLSDANWHYEASMFSVMYADEDYLIRTNLTTGDGRWWYRREVECYWVSPIGRQQGVTAAKIATGFVDQDPTFDDASAAMSVKFTCRDRLAVAMGWTSQGQQQVPRRLLNHRTLNDVDASVVGKGAPIPYGERIMPSGAVNAWYTRTVTLPDMNQYREFIIAGCAIKEIPSYTYTDNSVDPPTLETDPSEFIVPGSAAWNSIFGNTNTYIDWPGGDTVVRRWAMAYGLVGNAKVESVKEGTGLLRVNIRGVERVGDGSGALLTDIHDQFQHLLENVIMVPDEGPKLTWNIDPTFGNENIYIIDQVAFAELKARRLTEVLAYDLVELSGFGVVGAFGELTDVSTELEWWQMCGAFHVGQSRNHQIGIWAINEILRPEECAILDDEFSIHVRTFKPEYRFAELITGWDYRYQRNYGTEGWDEDHHESFSETAFANWSQENRRADWSFPYLVETDAMNFVRDRINKRRTSVPTYAVLEGDLCLMGPEFDVGQYLMLKHWRGIQASGWNGRPFWIQSNELLTNPRRVRLELLDIYDIVSEQLPDTWAAARVAAWR